MNQDFWHSYRDELIATSLVLGLSVFGTFFIASRLQQDDDLPETFSDESGNEIEVDEAEILGEKIEEAIEIATNPGNTPEPTALITPSATPTPGPLDTEVFYGIGGSYSFDEYEVVFNSPKLVFNLKESESRTFLINVILRNKNIEAGIQNRLTVSIVKDGNVIVSEAALSVSESRNVLPGEQLTFEARISLIEGTDVREIFYSPKNSSKHVEHELQPDNT